MKEVLCNCSENLNDNQKTFIRKLVCKDLPVKYKHNNNFYCIFHFPSDDKQPAFNSAFDEKISNEDYFFNGTWFPNYVDFSDFIFKQNVNFSNTIFNYEANFERAQFHANRIFIGTVFRSKVSFSQTLFLKPAHVDLETNFYSTIFEDAADFSSAKFYNTANFEFAKFLVGYSKNKNENLTYTLQTGFSYAEFYEAADFSNCDFGNVKDKNISESIYFLHSIFLETANFKNANFFIHTGFSNAVFRSVADFRNTKVCNLLSFHESSFQFSAKFSGKNKNHYSWERNGLEFFFVDTEKPEKISFHTLRLNPESFINTDLRKFEFTDIKWTIKNFAFDWSRFKDFRFWEDDAKNRKSGYEILSIVYRRLATNAEENNHYLDASKFRFTANEIQRIGSHWFGRFPSISWLYKWSSRYGENWWWALLILLSIVSFFAVYYQFAYFEICPKNTEDISKCMIRTMSFTESIHQSILTAALQDIEYRKTITTGEDVMILVEKILAPVQAALLALAIRRKFMR